MKQADQATILALRSESIATKVRVTWKLTRDTGGVDVSDRLLQITPRSTSLSPFIAGFSCQDPSIILANDDGIFSPFVDGSYLAGGFEFALGTAVQVEQGIRRKDGTYQYFDICTCYVRDLRWPRGQVELIMYSRWNDLRTREMPEEYSFGALVDFVSGEAPDHKLDPDRVFRDLAAYADKTYTADAQWEEIDLPDFLRQTRWAISGGVPEGYSIGMAIAGVAKSCLCTAYEDDSGEIAIRSEIWPRNWGARASTVGYFPDELNDTNCFGFEFGGGVALSASEVVVNYLEGGQAHYRDSTAETMQGRRTRTVALPYVPWYSQAAWAARLIYEWNSGFPYAISFMCPGWGLLLELNDRVYVRDPETNVRRLCRVVSRGWQPQSVGITAVYEPSADALWTDTFAEVNTSSWGGSDNAL